MGRPGGAAARRAVLLALVLAVAAVGWTPSAVAGEWTAARNNGCKVWNADPLPKETLEWSGGCLNGKASGEGVLTWYENGQPNGHYKGTLDAGHVVGKGTYEDHTGYRYQGEMSDHGPNGLGVAQYPGGMQYIGHWKNGKRDGAGVVHWPEGDRLEGTFKNGELDGKAVYVDPNGLRHQQLWKDGKQVK